MKILAFAFLAIPLFGQGNPTVTAAPASPPIANVGQGGASGLGTAYYLVVGNYPAGSTQSQIVTTSTAAVPLTSGNPNVIAWAALPGVLTYDVLSLPTPVFTGTCTCSIATALGPAVTTFSDTGGAKSVYTITAGANGGNANWYLNTVAYSFPKLRVIVNGVDHLAEIVSGANLPAFCLTGDLQVRTGTGLTPGIYFCNTPNNWVQDSSVNTGTTRSGVNTVPTSATPAFNLALGNTQTIVLSNNATATVSNIMLGASYNFVICQDATGSRTFAWPASVHGGMTIGSTLSKCSAQSFVSADGVNLYATSVGVLNE